MIFGFAAAAIAGFMLTAIPNWTGRMPLQGMPLVLLFFAWVLGRVAMATSAMTGSAFSAVVDLAFLAALFAVVLREILAGRHWRSLPMSIAIVVLIAANVLTQLDVIGWLPTGRLGERLGLAAVVLLISLIGGRIIPSFTRNWLAKQGEQVSPTPFGRFDVATLILVVAALSFWVALPENPMTGVALIAVALMSLARLVRWRGWRTVSEPMLWVLHAGYCWLAFGLGLLGAAILVPDAVPVSAGVHALTAGSIGTMTLAAHDRATRGHTGRSLTADPRTAAIYFLITLAAASRVAAPFFPNLYVILLMSSGAISIGAFSLFVACYGPMLIAGGQTRA